MRHWLLYTVARVGVFLLAIVVLWLVLGELWTELWWLGIICAAIIAFCISYLFFDPLKARVVEDIEARRAAKPSKGEDELAEDA